MKIERSLIGLAASFAVASELCRRNIYAQLTLGHRKDTDILADIRSKILKIQVKGKQGREWPRLREYGKSIDYLIFVDFMEKQDEERPDFYILTGNEFEKLRQREYDKQGDAPDIKPDMIQNHKEKWGKIMKPAHNNKHK